MPEDSRARANWHCLIYYLRRTRIDRCRLNRSRLHCRYYHFLHRSLHSSLVFVVPVKRVYQAARPCLLQAWTGI